MADETMTTNLGVYQAIAAISTRLAETGIAKGRRNEQQGYKFRGIDDVYNALAPLLAEHGLCILPRVLSRQVVERQSANNRALFYVTVQVAFDLVAAADGSRHECVTYGEAMDSADKATNKAMSAAYKYLAMQAFCIPTEGDNDADATTHDVVPLAEEIKRLAAQKGVALEKITKAYEVDHVEELSDVQAADALAKLQGMPRRKGTP